MNPSTAPEQFEQCKICGTSNCGRLIEKDNGSIRPMIDTGFRFKPMPVLVKPYTPSKYTAPLKRKRALCISTQEAADNVASEQRLAHLEAVQVEKDLVPSVKAPLICLTKFKI